jgi:predicted short-subunit dehydrogenase-like oxidoreductase (DUF2520 family)
MNIAIIGSGNVAFVLGKLLNRKGFVIKQVISRNSSEGMSLAQLLNCTYTNFSGKLEDGVDLVLIALSDDAITSCFDILKGYNKLVVHTAAAVSIDILAEVSPHYGIIYPLQSVRKEIERPVEIPFLFEANSIQNKKTIEKILDKISDKNYEASYEERIKLHVSAVFANNFVNHFYHLAAHFCEKENIPFVALRPLIEETAFRLRYGPPQNFQTGPAIRKDEQTLEKHLELLNNHPLLKEMYLASTRSIQQFNA